MQPKVQNGYRGPQLASLSSKHQELVLANKARKSFREVARLFGAALVEPDSINYLSPCPQTRTFRTIQKDSCDMYFLQIFDGQNVTECMLFLRFVHLHVWRNSHCTHEVLRFVTVKDKTSDRSLTRIRAGISRSGLTKSKLEVSR